MHLISGDAIITDDGDAAMTPRLKSLVLRLAKMLGLFAIARHMTRNDLRILAYHGVWFLGGHFGDRLFMSVPNFDTRMNWLSRSPYRAIALDQAIEQLRQGALETNSVVITIDDGWYGTYRYMLPVLEKYSLAATLYVYTGAVDSQRPLANILVPALLKLSRAKVVELHMEGVGAHGFRLAEPSECDHAADVFLRGLEGLDHDHASSAIRKLAADLGFDYDEIVSSRQFSFMTYNEIEDAARRGLDIQLHSHSHHLDVEAPQGIEDEIALNRSKLAPHVRGALRHFCYPSGVHCPEMYGHLERCGVVSATTVSTGLVAAGSNRYAMNRILDGETTTNLGLDAELSGFLELVRRARRSLKLAADRR